MIKVRSYLIIVYASITLGLSQDFQMLKPLWTQMVLILMTWSWVWTLYQQCNTASVDFWLYVCIICSSHVWHLYFLVFVHLVWKLHMELLLRYYAGDDSWCCYWFLCFHVSLKCYIWSSFVKSIYVTNGCWIYLFIFNWFFF